MCSDEREREKRESSCGAPGSKVGRARCPHGVGELLMASNGQTNGRRAPSEAARRDDCFGLLACLFLLRITFCAFLLLLHL